MAENMRLAWRCRRGLLELDILLQQFLDAAFPTLPVEAQQAFERLLDFADQDLLEFLMGSRLPDDPELADVVTRIRHTPPA